MSHKRSREEAGLPEDPEEDLLLGTHESSLFELQVRSQCIPVVHVSQIVLSDHHNHCLRAIINHQLADED